MIFYLTFTKNDYHTFEGIPMNRDTVYVLHAINEELALEFVEYHFKNEWCFLYSSNIIDDIFLNKFLKGTIQFNNLKNILK